MALLHALFWAFGLVVFLLGLQGVLYFPLTILYEVWKRRTLRRLPPFVGRVSAVVPAYNEERTIRVALETLLESEWPDLEVIVVDDGSLDGTAERVRDLAEAGRIRLIRQANAGKAAALNAGITAASGEVVLYTDADSLFFRDTVAHMARWFADPSIDAVCGNDMPLRAGTGLQKLLAITTHIGTGYVRRALSVIRCLPIISGNLGAIRRRVLQEIGGFQQIWGEDLEITWRLQARRKRIVFDPEPAVLADCPATFAALWKQRVRWVRSYLKVARLHRGLFLRRSAWPFSLYLPVNFANMAIVPVLQAALALALPVALTGGWLHPDGPWEILSWLGLSFFFAVAVYGILLDRDLRDLWYLPWGLLILPVSYFYNAVVIHSWWKEMRRAEEKWEKIRRLGPSPAPPRQWAFGASMVAVALAAAAATWTWMARERAAAPPPGAVALEGAGVARPAFQLSLSTHFDAWPDWRDATRRLLDRPLVGMADLIGIGAGRAEWTYFRWAGHEERWSNHQKGEPRDLLLVASQELRDRGFRVAAFIDLYAPGWIRTHPGAAAIQADGTPHPEQVSLAELAEGEFGKVVLEMIEYLAASYPIDAIDVTEAAYRHTSFGPADLASYRRASGRSSWPRDWRGRVDVDDPTVWEWKCGLLESFVARAAEAAHRHGKLLYLDVAASWKDLRRDGKDHGHDYARLLRHADHLVVWDYFALEGLPPEASRELARRLAATLPAGRWTLSVGLWGPGGKVVPAADLAAALAASVEGGAGRIWVTPVDQITPQHWDAILRTWLVPAPRPPPGAAQAAAPPAAGKR
ncbi:MAG TPA: glycosyltransferase family 2 protein [Anaeromyxobacteraceae bacterium]|nr:glycosyltransferase family 2 protein [Anaeromyxobacteraceae bacterium]